MSDKTVESGAKPEAAIGSNLRQQVVDQSSAFAAISKKLKESRANIKATSEKAGSINVTSISGQESQPSVKPATPKSG